jgi:2-oxoglutarate ferredoxin oxidoreductase subunit gamma
MEKYEPQVKSGGLLLVNSSLIEQRSERDDVDAYYIPASEMATELGNVRMANMVLLGALVELTGIVALETIMDQLDAHLSQRQRKWLAPNKTALTRGAALVKEAVMA